MAKWVSAIISYNFLTCITLCMIGFTFAINLSSPQKQRLTDVSGFRINKSVIHQHARVLSDPSIGSECHTVFESLSSAVLNYSQCVITNALSSTVCANCVRQYETARMFFEMDLEEIRDDFGQLCSDRMIVSAGKQMKIEAENFVTNSWNNLHCSDLHCTVAYQKISTLASFLIILRCFANQSSGQLLPDYGEFFGAFGLLLDCILDSTNAHVDVKLFAPMNVTGNNSVCRDCGELWYKKLHDIYIKLNARDVARVCQDIGDVMNYTRYVWRDIFECKSKPRNNLLLWIVSAFLSVLPITFYVASLLNGSDITKKLVLQKRLRNYSSVQNMANASVG